MRIQKIKNAFTLVELIVVITILAVLATLAFISFSGSVVKANNTKVSSDVRNLVSKVSIKSSYDIALDKMFLSGSTSNKAGSISIVGGQSPNEYDVGKIDFSILGESEENFVDDNRNSYIYGYAYVFTMSNGRNDDYSFFQIAGELIDNSGNKTAIVKGNYTPFTGTDSPSLIAEKTDDTVFIVNEGDATNMY